MATTSSSALPEIFRLTRADEAEVCARLMSQSEPWLTLGRDYHHCLAVLRQSHAEVWLAGLPSELLGFVLLRLDGPFPGYIQTIAVASAWRGRGVGTRLLHFAEERIGQVSPNVFICVSSFNPGARRLYERLGFKLVGQLNDYIVPGHHELLLRKTRGSWSDFP